MSFSYTSVPLYFNHIRILTLSPSESAETRPSCSLEAVDLEEAPAFTALSYAWGDASQRTSIQVNGKDLSITSALALALRHLRLPDRERRLWIDQICINQADDDEKASQVRLMRQIYSEAENTVAWLGEEKDGSDEVMRFIQEAGREGFKIGLRDVPRDDYASLRWHVTAAFSNLDSHDLDVAEGDPLGKKKTDLCKLIDSRYSEQWDDMLDHLYLLFARPYFRRGWIKQEVVIPRTLILQCGRQTVGGDEFVSFVRLDSFISEAKRQQWTARITRMQQEDREALIKGKLDAAGARTRSERLSATVAKAQVINSAQFNERFGLGQTVGIRSRYHMGGHWQEEMTLAFMLKTFASDLEFTDPRDRIFGLLGMASDTSAIQIQVDYTIPWQEVYADAIKRIIHAGYVDILYDIYSAPSPPTSLPSWCPDLNIAKAGIIKKYTFLSSHPFSAGGPPLPSHRVPSAQQFSSPPTLLIRGFQVDTVLTTIPLWTPDSSGSYFADNLTSLKSVLTKLYDLSKLSRSQFSSSSHNLPPSILPSRRAAAAAAADENSALRTAILDHESVSPSSSGGRKRRATVPRMHAAIADLARGIPQLHGAELRDYLNQAQVLQYLAPWFGQRGFIGLGPRETKAGDVVVVFYGGSVPFVLRPDGAKGGPTWRVVGEGYCDGIMDREGVGWGEERVFTLV
ncbi:HET-domain-containing protein [Coniochaeta hoffmannii]|uniref:HET-domain-containing protein n=1 Tax=Coniochaeta hoffmannii TaxID=91930 RepID=A0AA38R5C5_9PEZI|nr:HET-domain-containing protein [Coniochaeta hoffmannii]